MPPAQPEKRARLFENFFRNFRFGKLSIAEQAFFAKRLSFLINAGVSLVEALNMIKEQTVSRSYRRVLEQIIADVTSGRSLSDSLKRFKNAFGDFAISIISVGEETGALSDNLSYLAEELKKRQLLRRKVVGAMVYPIFITFATIGITSLLIVFIFPKIMPIFLSLSVELPITTKILIALSNFLGAYGLWLLLGLIVLAIIFRLVIKKNRHFHFFFDRLSMRTPLIGPMIQNYNLANISRTLSLLLNGGMTLSEALPITSRSTTNLVYRRELEKLAEVANRGEKISSHMKNYRKLFPDVLSQIISVGERSGNLSETLNYLSDMYESEVEDSTKNLSNMIEPVLMVVMGLMVGFVAVSIITPIYSITQGLQR
ncbi:MAG: type II secretion system F family protein [Minisyncoccia bacterium]